MNKLAITYEQSVVDVFTNEKLHSSVIDVILYNQLMVFDEILFSPNFKHNDKISTTLRDHTIRYHHHEQRFFAASDNGILITINDNS